MTKDEALRMALSVLNEVRSETFRLLRNGQKLYAEEKVWNAIYAIREALAEQPAQEEDPCPGCRKGGVCRTPKCGRLKLPVDHPFRSAQPEKVTLLPDGAEESAQQCEPAEDGVCEKLDCQNHKPAQQYSATSDHCMMENAHGELARINIVHTGFGIGKPEQEPVAWMSDQAVGFKKSEFGNYPCVPLYTSPPARKPLTHEQRVDLLAKFEPIKHEWHAPAILIDMVEAAHGITGEHK